MKLLTKEILARLPALYTTEETPMDEKVIQLKYFVPWNQWTFYVVEGQEEDGDFRFFGLVHGQETEWGYFSLNELQSLRGPGGLRIERDLYFRPGPFAEVRQREPMLKGYQP